MVLSSSILKALRNFYGLSTTQFETETGIARSTLTKLERNDNYLKLCNKTTLERIRKYYTHKGALVFADKTQINIVLPLPVNESLIEPNNKDDIFASLSQTQKIDLMKRVAASLKEEIE